MNWPIIHPNQMTTTDLFIKSKKLQWTDLFIQPNQNATNWPIYAVQNLQWPDPINTSNTKNQLNNLVKSIESQRLWAINLHVVVRLRSEHRVQDLPESCLHYSSDRLWHLKSSSTEDENKWSTHSQTLNCTLHIW